jgi:hypothetical protein
MQTKTRVNQIELAAELGLTDRRVRQLSKDCILPEPHHADGLFDLALCRERFELYRDGSDRDWEDFYRDLEDDTKKTKTLFERAISDAGTADDVRAASLAVQANGESFRFVTACKSKTSAERDMFLGIWKREEDQALGGLIYRATVIMGGDRIVDDDGTVLATLPIYPDVPKASVRKGPARRARRVAAAGKRA